MGKKGTFSNTTLQTLGSPLRSTLGLYRFFSLIAAALFTVLYFSVKEDSNDPLWPRLTLSGLFLGIFAVTFLSQKVRKNIRYIFAGLMYLCMIWNGALLLFNNLNPDYVATYYVLLFSATLVYDSREGLQAFSVFNLILVIIVCWLVQEPAIEPVPFALLVVVVVIVSYVTIGFRIRSQEGLTKGRDQLKIIKEAAFESSRDAILIVNLDGFVVDYNQAFLDTWKIDSVTMESGEKRAGVERAWEQLKDPEAFNKVVHQCWENPEIETKDLLEFKDGRFSERFSKPLFRDNRIVGRLWFFRDVTERKQTELRLIASERALKAQNEGLVELAASHSLNSGDLQAAFEEITSTAAKLLQVDNVAIWFLAPGEEAIIVQKLYRLKTGTFEQGQVFPFSQYAEYLEAIIRNRIFAVTDTRKNPLTKEFIKGKYSGPCLSLIHAPIRIGGQVKGMVSLEQESDPRVWTMEEQNFASSMADLVAVSMEANAKRIAQNELEKSLAILQATFELSETGIRVENNEKDVIAFNELYLKIWNMPEDFIKTASFQEQVAFCIDQLKEDDDSKKKILQLRHRSDAEYHGILEFKDGRVVERYTKKLEVNGQIEGRVWFYLDITKRTRREEELMDRNFELDSFVYRASHDLKAPLNSIMGLINLMRGEEDINHVQTYLGMMDKSVIKLDEFIRNLAEFSQDARLGVSKKALDLDRMVHDTLETLRFMEQAERVDFNINIHQPERLVSDPIRTGIVISNLISNSIKYQDMEKDNPWVKIDIRVDENWARIVVEDNGVGIEDEYMNKVFDLFFRASIQSHGSGMGLYITYNAIEKMGGKIKIDSTFGEGTRFEIDLPNHRLDENIQASA